MTMQTPQGGEAIYFDGKSNRKRRVTLRLGSALDIVEDGKVAATWAYETIRRADGSPRVLRLSSLSAAPLARLEVNDADVARTLASHCPALDAGRGPNQTWRIVGWSLAAACSIVLVAAYGIPLAADRLAPLVPVAVEKRIGEAVDKQVALVLGGNACRRTEGHDAFKAMVGKIASAGGLEMPAAEVLSIPLPNAFALPGGKIYVTDGLLQKAQSVDEVAGVIAHELGHVQHRDSLRKIIQTGGTSFLVGLLFGDLMGSSVVIFATRSMLDATYSREAERDADAFAAETMHKLGRSPRPMGEFLLRVTGPEAKKGITILSSHPLSEDRLTAMKAQDRPNSGPEILSAREWTALKGVCKGS